MLSALSLSLFSSRATKERRCESNPFFTFAALKCFLISRCAKRRSQEISPPVNLKLAAAAKERRPPPFIFLPLFCSAESSVFFDGVTQNLLFNWLSSIVSRMNFELAILYAHQHTKRFVSQKLVSY